MQHFSSDGLDIAYLDEGKGDPILLIHGFASSARVNWVDTGWVSTLVDDGRRVIVIDNRGHGQSSKPHDPRFYGAPVMAKDAVALLDHLKIDSADVMGYSMGARITAFISIFDAKRIRSAVFGGLGISMVRGFGDSGPIAQALEAPHLDDIEHKTGRTFRLFAESSGGDLLALAACMRSSRQRIAAEQLARLNLPVLVAVGTKDLIAGSASELAAIIPNAAVLDITGRDHMRAVGDKVYREGVLSFLARNA